jgi:hypothetical protein
MAPWCDHGVEERAATAREVGMHAQVALPLAAVVKAGPLAALVVTVVLLLVVGAIFWSFLRRARKQGVSALEVDRFDAPHLPEPPDPTVLAAEADLRGPTQ